MLQCSNYYMVHCSNHQAGTELILEQFWFRRKSYLILSYLYFVKQPLMIIPITKGYKGTTYYNVSTHGAAKNLPSPQGLAWQEKSTVD